ncbi:MAG TPA: gliding motility-associated C-terminal domain-containing protein, partial [Chitinophagales bacterium]|nr:gliding motility-associated C-terminal domain-containing protein [Chitinophagales bacterium]
NGCDGGTGTITATVSNGTPPFTFAWSNGATGGTATGFAAGNHCVTVTDANGCTNTACADVTVQPNLGVNAGNDQTICGGAAGATLNASPGSATSLIWTVTSGGATVTNPSSASTTVTGLTDVNVFLLEGQNNGCSDFDTVVIFYNNVTANAGSDTSGCDLNAVQLNASGSGSWSVLSGSGSLSSDTASNALFTNPGTGANVLVWTVTGGPCSAKDTITVTALSCDTIIPNGFTPNGDGFNDRFVIGKIGNYPVNDFKVFNRWGNVVYQKTNYNNEWDGTNNDGERLPDATYFVVFTSENSGGIEYAGYVNLRRQ